MTTSNRKLLFGLAAFVVVFVLVLLALHAGHFDAHPYALIALFAAAVAGLFAASFVRD